MDFKCFNYKLLWFLGKHDLLMSLLSVATQSDVLVTCSTLVLRERRSEKKKKEERKEEDEGQEREGQLISCQTSSQSTNNKG